MLRSTPTLSEPQIQCRNVYPQPRREFRCFQLCECSFIVQISFSAFIRCLFLFRLHYAVKHGKVKVASSHVKVMLPTSFLLFCRVLTLGSCRYEAKLKSAEKKGENFADSFLSMFKRPYRQNSALFRRTSLW